MHVHQHRIDLCNQALDAVRLASPADLFGDAYDDITHFDERGLGMEVLIDQLAEFEIQINCEQFGLIKGAIDSLSLDECDRLVYLREHELI